MEHPLRNQDFGELLRRRRLAAHLTQEELAERSGLSARSVRNLERGRVRFPRPASLRLLGSALGLAGEDLRAFEALGRTAYWTERNLLAAAS
jgi:transcriptional regulator with XRE-family HTH domain